MKRSEMLKGLIQTMGDYESWADQCDSMLQMMEDLGMLPPKQIDCYPAPEVVIRGKNEWEPEVSNSCCIVCDKVLDFEPRYCCNAFDCGCGGRPIDPPVCSEQCYKKAYEKD